MRGSPWQDPLLALPTLGFRGASGGRPDQPERKSLYFLRTNGNKPLLVYFLVNCEQASGLGAGAGINSFSSGFNCPPFRPGLL